MISPIENYEMSFLSDLWKQPARRPDFIMAVDCIFGRLHGLNEASPHSQFNTMVLWIRRLIPRFFLIRLLHLLRYDTMICFKNGTDGREIYCMISFQKHPKKSMIGMFDFYVVPHLRGKSLVGNFEILAEMVYQLSQKFKQSFSYLQCGKNITTQRVLRLYQRVANKKGWEIRIDVEASRIYLQNEAV